MYINIKNIFIDIITLIIYIILYIISIQNFLFIKSIIYINNI